MATWTTVCFDCADAGELASFYARLLGWPDPESDQPWIVIRDPEGGVGLSFQSEDWYEPPKWPERPGDLTKMIHLEVAVDDIEVGVRDAVGAGATPAPHQPPDRDPSTLRVMLDPAGHPFCLFAR